MEANLSGRGSFRETLSRAACAYAVWASWSGYHSLGAGPGLDKLLNLFSLFEAVHCGKKEKTSAVSFPLPSLRIWLKSASHLLVTLQLSMAEAQLSYTIYEDPKEGAQGKEEALVRASASSSGLFGLCAAAGCCAPAC